MGNSPFIRVLHEIRLLRVPRSAAVRARDLHVWQELDIQADHACSVTSRAAEFSRIVGRDTSELTDQEVRTAALETLAENLSDGVIAPLFWYLLLGVPGMLAYKMVNTLDSMIGYRNERYLQFGCVAAHIDDMANYIPSNCIFNGAVCRASRFAEICR